MKIAETVTFGGSGLDRAAHMRVDQDARRSEMKADMACVMALWRGKPLLQERSASLAFLPCGFQGFGDIDQSWCFLGKDGEIQYYATDVSLWVPDKQPEKLDVFLDETVQRHPDLPNTYFGELRQVMGDLSPRHAELAATAKAILGWQKSHQFCANCGQKSVLGMSGWQRDCPACGTHHFPRTDPVVIMLITSGNDVLLGRSPGWPDGMFSLLAGFVEPGESIEAAVRREVLEESSIVVGQVDYLASQPWPYPSSIMIGCRGEALNREINIDPEEVEEARWVSREELAQAMAGQHPQMRAPRRGSIAQFILTHWLSDRLD